MPNPSYFVIMRYVHIEHTVRSWQYHVLTPSVRGSSIVSVTKYFITAFALQYSLPTTDPRAPKSSGKYATLVKNGLLQCSLNQSPAMHKEPSLQRVFKISLQSCQRFEFIAIVSPSFESLRCSQS